MATRLPPGGRFPAAGIVTQRCINDAATPRFSKSAVHDPRCAILEPVSRAKAAPDQPTLRTFDDCLREITRCNSEIARLQEEYRQWSAANPEGSWPGAVGLIGYWQKRNSEADARFADLISHSR